MALAEVLNEVRADAGIGEELEQQHVRDAPVEDVRPPDAVANGVQHEIATNETGAAGHYPSWHRASC